MIRVLDILEDTMVDGPGFRTSIYCAGCNHQCPGCHNPQSWAFDGGHEMTTQQLLKIIMDDPFANVTFSGGDPMYQAAGFAELARAIHENTNKDIWCFTGFTFESLIQDDVERLKDPDLLFRGSSNQRIIDVPTSLYQGKVVLWREDISI